MADDLPPIPLEDGPDAEEIREAKRGLRREVAARIRATSPEERATESAKVCELLMGSPDLLTAPESAAAERSGGTTWAASDRILTRLERTN